MTPAAHRNLFSVVAGDHVVPAVTCLWVGRAIPAVTGRGDVPWAEDLFLRVAKGHVTIDLSRRAASNRAEGVCRAAKCRAEVLPAVARAKATNPSVVARLALEVETCRGAVLHAHAVTSTLAVLCSEVSGDVVLGVSSPAGDHHRAAGLVSSPCHLPWATFPLEADLCAAVSSCEKVHHVGHPAVVPRVPSETFVLVVRAAGLATPSVSILWQEGESNPWKAAGRPAYCLCSRLRPDDRAGRQTLACRRTGTSVVRDHPDPRGNRPRVHDRLYHPLLYSHHLLYCCPLCLFLLLCRPCIRPFGNRPGAAGFGDRCAHVRGNRRRRVHLHGRNRLVRDPAHAIFQP